MSVAQPVMVVAHSCVSLEMTWAVMVHGSSQLCVTGDYGCDGDE